MDRDDGGAGSGCERFGRDRWRGILPPGVGENGSSIVSNAYGLAWLDWLVTPVEGV